MKENLQQEKIVNSEYNEYSVLEIIIDEKYELDMQYNKGIGKYEKIIFNIDFSKKLLTLKQADKLIKDVKKLEKRINKENIQISTNITKGKSKCEEFVINSILLINIKDKKMRYDYLYDSICDYLDKQVVDTNACKFINDKCIAKRDTNCTMGCCHHFKNKYFGLLYERNLRLCEYQKDKRCIAKCITCKMYMCDVMKKRGYNFNTRNILTIKRYFNPIQKLIIISSFFIPKEKILKKLLFCSIV